MKHRYELGNCLRGYFSLECASDRKAWEVLRKRFNQGFPAPTEAGRHVGLWRFDPASPVCIGEAVDSKHTGTHRLLIAEGWSGHPWPVLDDSLQLLGVPDE